MQLQTGVNAALREAASGMLQAVAERNTLPMALQALTENEAIAHAVLEPLEVALSRARRSDASQVLLLTSGHLSSHRLQDCA